MLSLYLSLAIIHLYGCSTIGQLIRKKVKIHERALRIACKDSCSDFEELLPKTNAASSHNKKVLFIAMEIYKIQRIQSYLLEA